MNKRMLSALYPDITAVSTSWRLTNKETFSPET